LASPTHAAGELTGCARQALRRSLEESEQRGKTGHARSSSADKQLGPLDDDDDDCVICDGDGGQGSAARAPVHEAKRKRSPALGAEGAAAGKKGRGEKQAVVLLDSDSSDDCVEADSATRSKI